MRYFVCIDCCCVFKTGVPTVDFAGWERIDQVETERGKAVGKPREKIVDVAEMLEIASTVR